MVALRPPLLLRGQPCQPGPPVSAAPPGCLAAVEPDPVWRQLKNGVFHSLVDLQAAINRFIREYNASDPKPFVWKADPDEIIAAGNRGFQTLESIH